MEVIVDASVVVKWFVAEDLHEEARRLLRTQEALFAPDIVVAEVANAFWLKVGRDEMDESVALRNLTAISGRGEPELRPSSPLAPDALQLGLRLDHPVYDCLYLALALQLAQPLMTADRRLASVAAGHPDLDVRLLGD